MEITTRVSAHAFPFSDVIHIHLVRHGTAGRRTEAPNDIERPLDANGQRQADAIAEALAGCGAETVVSSPATRCRQTIAPLAKGLGVPVEINGTLWEAQDPRATLALVRRFAGAGSPAVICSHGAIIPPVLQALAEGGVGIDDTAAAKGSVWTFTAAAGAITSARYRRF